MIGRVAHPASAEPLRRRLREIDFVMLCAVLALIALGSLIILSASRSAEAPLGLLRVRALQVGISVALLVAFAAMPYRALADAWKLIYFGNLVLLALVGAIGRTSLGAQRWLSVGPLSIQPSEFAKLALIITLSKLLSERREPIRRFADLIPFVAHVAPSAVLVFLQPDLGTSLVFVAILFALLFAAGTPLRSLAIVGAAGLAAAPFCWHLVKPYQRMRLAVFLDPSLDPLGAGYNLIQSKIAVGSGKLFGKGVFEGTQNALQFLPMQHTDFAFSVLGEEMGFVGAIGALALFLILLWRALRTAAVAQDGFGAYLAVGVAAMIAVHVFVNVGMTMGIMPVTGIPLPFISHGGTSLMTNSAAIGLLFSVLLRRQKIHF
ncbi:MAG: rod shape-determining protein RodA [Armatimonadetes bacterium]|nr:rod shape-determining protein RodA [Armatimonadota bacterium]